MKVHKHYSNPLSLRRTTDICCFFTVAISISENLCFPSVATKFLNLAIEKYQLSKVQRTLKPLHAKFHISFPNSLSAWTPC